MEYSEQFMEHIEYAFHAFCKVVLRHEARQTALDYYRDTVFTVNSIEYTEERAPYGDVEGSCNFIVNVSKGGEIQEPDRMITLQMEDGRWRVVNEGI